MARFDGIDFGDSRHDGLGSDAIEGLIAALATAATVEASGDVVISSGMVINAIATPGTVSLSGSIIYETIITAIGSSGSASATGGAEEQQVQWGGIDDGDTRHTGLGGIDPGTLNGAIAAIATPAEVEAVGDSVGGAITGTIDATASSAVVAAAGEVGEATVVIPIRFIASPRRRPEVVRPIRIDGQVAAIAASAEVEISGNVAVPVISGQIAAVGHPAISEVTGFVDTSIVDEEEEIILLVAALFAA